MLFLQAAEARRAIARTFAEIHYSPTPEATRAVAKGVMRDLQARRLRPNVPVPSRRNPLKFVRLMHTETGSLSAAVAALLHDGSWTSSGGSFRLAEQLGVSIPELCETTLRQRGQLRYLEIGAGWAGMRAPLSNGMIPRDAGGLAQRYQQELGETAHLHLTNLTPWHERLPVGVTEHAHVTAAGLSVLELQGVARRSVDLIYSQAAAYFETDHVSFVRAACRLLAPEGTMIFNHRPAIGAEVDAIMAEHGVRCAGRIELGGMNGSVAHFQRPAEKAAQRILAAYDPAFRRSATL